MLIEGGSKAVPTVDMVYDGVTMSVRLHTIKQLYWSVGQEQRGRSRSMRRFLQSFKFVLRYMDRVKRIWYLSPMRAAKVQASLRIRAVSPEPPLLAHTSIESRGTFRQKARSLAPLNGWACAVKICHDGLLEDTNSLDGAHMSLILKQFQDTLLAKTYLYRYTILSFKEEIMCILHVRNLNGTDFLDLMLSEDRFGNISINVHCEVM